MTIGYQDQKDVQQEGMLAERGPETIAQEAMLQEREAARNRADALGAEGTFLNHGSPPCP